MIDLGLVQQCTFGVHPATVVAIIQVESKGDRLALNVNALPRQPAKALDVATAAQTAQTYIDAGYSVDMGLMQVNSQHFERFQVSPAQVLEPCQNILIGSTILYEAYQRAQRSGLAGEAAMRAALSAYNTGHFTRGETNGYVSRVFTGKNNKTLDAIAAKSPARVEFNTRQGEPDMPSKNQALTDSAIAQVRDVHSKNTIVQTEVSPEVAERMGAFEEDAISEAEAIESLFDDEIGTDE